MTSHAARKTRLIVTGSLLSVSHNGSKNRTMQKVMVAATAAVILAAGGAVALWHVNAKPPAPMATVSSLLRHPTQTAQTLEFRELFNSGPKLIPSAKALALNGKRVRMVGFMANMEVPIEGGFYLVPRPLSLDEAGGGTADLPLESVLVVVPSKEGRIIPHVAGALEGVGILEVGNRSDDQGRVSNFRLKLDLQAGVAAPQTAEKQAMSH